MAIAVTTVASGGLPVTDVTATNTRLGLHVAEVAKGLAITKGPGGLAVNFAPVADWPSGGGGGGGGAEAAAFLARTSGLNGTHTAAYTTLIDGLVADGVWSKLDVLHVYATQDSTTALLNLVSTSYNGTAVGPPVFTADRGFQGVNNSNTVCLSTNFNPTSASSPKYTLNSGHLSVWSVTNITNQAQEFAVSLQTGAGSCLLSPKHFNDNSYFCINGANYGVPNFGNGVTQGLFIANRPNSTTIEGYKNLTNTSSSTSNNATQLPSAGNGITVLATRSPTSVTTGCNIQAGMASIGAGLTTTDVTNFYNRLRAYMTSVGVP